jgi:hypothetical protein
MRSQRLRCDLTGPIREIDLKRFDQLWTFLQLMNGRWAIYLFVVAVGLSLPRRLLMVNRQPMPPFR